jgi:RecG-like helicase
MGLLERLRRRLTETDEERLAQEIHEWASRVPGAVRIAECPTRRPVKVAGVVKRITVTPIQGAESLEAVITDGTGEITVMWMGRRSIPGLTLGTHVIVEGVVAQDRAGRRMVNPKFEFAA